MTVREMIKLLEQEDPDAMVLVSGYETGWDEATEPEVVEVVKTNTTKDYEGLYDCPRRDDPRPLIRAVAIHGDQRRLWPRRDD